MATEKCPPHEARKRTGPSGPTDADIVALQLPVSVKQLRRCLRSLTRSEDYLSATGLDGQPTAVVTEKEYPLCRLRLEKILNSREYTESEPA